MAVAKDVLAKDAAPDEVQVAPVAEAGSATEAVSVTESADPYAEYERAVAVYTAAGGQESVQRIVTAISRVGRRLDVFYRQQFADLDISLGDWNVLTALAAKGPRGHCTASHLADRAGVSPSTMTHRLDQLVARGFVVRVPDPANRTRMSVSLTVTGWNLFVRAITDANVVETRLITPLSEGERSQLAALLDKVIAGLPA